MSEIETLYLRAMDESDLDSVMSIEQQAYDFPWSEQGFLNSLDQGFNFVFCDLQHRLLGYACLLKVLDEAHLLNFCIAPVYQGKGLASLALKQLIERLREAQFAIVLLEVRESNAAARGLYRKHAFSEDGVRRNYYPVRDWDLVRNDYVETREDAILMSHRFA
ncbi:MAG: ribosomal protein S18-alanine N-acetyltransferase [Thiotrichales bacterium]|nr:ribosomal protein S18-alanine N-acetyltransferase [Thiotrichales bacterium]